MVDELKAKDVKGFDFLDFGASKAESIEYGKKHFFGKRGLGIDLDDERVALMNKSGYSCLVGDLTKINLPAGCVKFVKMAHILEHMPDLKGVEKALAAAKKAATDFLVITGPFFDQEDYLRSMGFKLHWSDYADHPCHLRVSQLVEILKKLKMQNFEIYLRYPILDSLNPHVHPLTSPQQSHRYDPKIHPPKKKTAFDRLIWTDFVCYVRLGQVKNWKTITNGYRDQIPYLESKNGMVRQWPEELLEKYVELDSELQSKNRVIQDLKTTLHQLTDKKNTLEKQLAFIKSSKTWKVTRLLQLSSAIIRKPVLSIKRIVQ